MLDISQCKETFSRLLLQCHIERKMASSIYEAEEMCDYFGSHRAELERFVDFRLESEGSR